MDHTELYASINGLFDTPLIQNLHTLLDAVPPPVWWRHPIARLRFRSRKEWIITRAAFEWPGWYTDAIKLGVDPDHLLSVYMLTTGRAPSEYVKMPARHWR